MTFSYDGTNYNGYQKQNNKNTIQDNIETNLSKILNEKTRIFSSGRTDAKVHAINQKAHFNSDKEINIEKIRNSLNKLINKDIYIKKIEKVEDNFHARFNVLEKVYIYKINPNEYNPLYRYYIYQYCKKLDIDLIKEASLILIGTHNFKSFTKSDITKNDFERTIYDIKINNKNNIIEIEFKGNGFLRYMVRNIVGLLIEIGSEKRKIEDVKKILDSKNRQKSGITAPACGLYLKNVKY